MQVIEAKLSPEQEAIAQELIQRTADLAKARVLENFRDQMDDVLTKAGLVDEKDYIIEIRYKAPDRIREKLARKGYASVDKMQDLAGATIVVKKQRNMTRVKRLIQQNFTVKHVSDYGNDMQRAYGGVNMNLVNIEVQIKDAMEYFLGFWDHDAIYKNPDIEKRYREKLIRRFRKNIKDYMQKNNIEINFSSRSYIGIINVLKETIEEVFKVPYIYSKGIILRSARTSNRSEYKMRRPTGVPVSSTKRKIMTDSATRIAKKQL